VTMSTVFSSVSSIYCACITDDFYVPDTRTMTVSCLINMTVAVTTDMIYRASQKK